MLFLPTRGRPDACVAMIAAMQAVDDVPDVAVMIDDEAGLYADVQWPAHWKIHEAPYHLEMTRSINTLLGLYPHRPFYGFFGDHFRPQTAWSKPLREAAGDWFISWPEDNVYSHRQVSAAPHFGRKLIEVLGCICLPTTIHLCTDRPWWFLWKHLGIGRVVPEAVVTHDRPEISNCPKDANHDRLYRGVAYARNDFLAWKDWEANDAQRVMARIRVGMIADGFKFDREGRLYPGQGGMPFQAGW